MRIVQTLFGRTLFGKLLLLFLGFGALMGLSLVYVMKVSHETYHLEFEQTANRDLARQYVAANLLIREPPLTAHNFSNALQRLIEINPAIDVYVLDGKGEILAGSASTSVGRQRVALEPIAEFLTGRAKFPLLGDNPSNARGREVFSAAPLSIPDCPAAYLYVVLHREENETNAPAGLKTLYAIHEGIGVVIVAVALAIAASLLFLHMLTRRLGVLQLDIERFRDSRFAEFPAEIASVGPNSGDEVERLRLLFMDLAERIRGQMNQLQQTDQVRRELFANVSHDLRTPLATLSVHLETLSLQENLSIEERRNYVGVALAQCRRLGKLIEQLLELAKLDAGQVHYAPEPFQLAELVHDVAHKFQLSAKRAGAELRIEHPNSMPLVLGDIQLLERVLDNLLENALRYVAGGGHVAVRLLPQASSVRVEVHDSGPGIPASDRERVFDRFYRGDKSRSTESGYAGLGLAIVRGILELHGQAIDFVSPPNQGTTFFFDLAIASDVMDRAA